MKIYTLGNDYVHNDLRVLLSSLRQFNPDISVTVIPWDNNITQTSATCADFGADLLNTDLSRYDNLGSYFSRKYEKGNRIFRKFAAFHNCEGPFLFLDADCLVLGRLDVFFQIFDSRELDVLFYARSGRDRNFTFPDAKSLSERILGNSEGYNAAWFMSRAQLFSYDLLDLFSRRMLSFERNFGVKHEQAFLNYLCLIYGCNVDIVSNINRRLSASWNINSKIAEKDGEYYYEGRGQPPISVLHYSSPTWRDGENKYLYDFFLNRVP